MKNPNHGNWMRIFVLAAALLAPNLGLAQEAEREPSGEGWQPIKRLSFTAEEIEGGTFAPDGTRIESIVRATHPSLIELREGFEAELVKMLEDM